MSFVNNPSSGGGGGVSDGDKGDVTISGSGTVYTIDNNVVTYAKMQDVSTTDVFLGRDTAGAGDVEEISASAAKTILSLNNVENTALSTWAGSANITTVGTVGTGTWNGTKIAEGYGGTNQTTYTKGDILYASAANTLSKLSVGSDTQVLTLSGGVPTWAAPSAGGSTNLGTIYPLIIGMFSS